jgi:hypothetical protein
MAYSDDTPEVRKHKHTEETVRWVVFFIAATIITLASLVFAYEYEELKRDCPVIVEDPRG